MSETSERINSAVLTAKLTQRELEKLTGISQSTLCRILAGKRTAKIPELLAIAEATGCSIGALTGVSTVAERVQCAARSTNGSNMAGMREEMLHFVELNDYLDDLAVPVRG
ncbi:helix-turn-helix domain-containing protein [Nocardia alni]|uniref:helix-turn-helix domain-containing protein n=1 Tax=Nocardia alni TaxID=2815723 RepID=UPI0020B1A6EF|nr:helix-turn-helix transcriptional regulator [Nocardia alni]